MNYVLVIVAILLASVVAIAASIARQGKNPRCPACKSRDVAQMREGYRCNLCGERFLGKP
jgi:tRNA(Ile2) C34 agmatinyltransferase TiaS